MTIEEAIKLNEKAFLVDAKGNTDSWLIEANHIAIKALKNMKHLKEDIYDEVYMMGYYPTDKPEELSKYHLFVPYKVVEHFIKGEIE